MAPAISFVLPWPTLPDGRVVLEIAEYRLAFPPDTGCGEVQLDTVPERFERRDLAEFIRDLAGTRAAFEGANSVWITDAHNAPGRLLGRYDRLALLNTRISGIGLYPSAATACAAPFWSGHDLLRRLRERLDPPEPTWCDVDARFRAVVDDILLTGWSGTPP